MAARQLQSLGLDYETAARLADFHESYANFVLKTPELADPRTNSAQHHAASALLLASQWAMLMDAENAKELLVRAGKMWHSLGHGFGTFLLAAFAPEDLAASDARRRLASLETVLRANAPNPDTSGSAAESARTEVPPSSPLWYPQQQVYLLIAASAIASRHHVRRLLESAHTSSHQSSPIPVGALGTPLRVYWQIAETLMSVPDSGYAVAQLVRYFELTASTYSQNLESAMSNEWLWANGASPVYLVDVDLIAIAAIASRRIGFEILARELEFAIERARTPVARVPLEVALDVLSNM